MTSQPCSGDANGIMCCNLLLFVSNFIDISIPERVVLWTIRPTISPPDITLYDAPLSVLLLNRRTSVE